MKHTFLSPCSVGGSDSLCRWLCLSVCDAISPDLVSISCGAKAKVMSHTTDHYYCYLTQISWPEDPVWGRQEKCGRLVPRHNSWVGVLEGITVSLLSTNGRQFACHWCCARKLWANLDCVIVYEWDWWYSFTAGWSGQDFHIMLGHSWDTQTVRGCYDVCWCLGTKQVLSHGQPSLYTTLNKVEEGYTGFALYVCQSVHLWRESTILARSISYLHISPSNSRRCVTCKVFLFFSSKLKNLKFWQIL